MNKRGQFYLVISLVIVASIVGLASVYNLTKMKPSSDIYSFKEELNIESERVMDYFVYTGNSVLEDFTKDHSDYMGKNSRIIYVLENGEEDLEVFEYNSSNDQKVNYDPYLLDYDSSAGTGKIKVEVNSINYTFDLKEGQDFYFIMIKEGLGEKHVITNAN